MIGTEIPGDGGCGVDRGLGRAGELRLTLRRRHYSGFCLKVGSDESLFNVSLIVMGQSQAHKTVFINHNC